MALKTFVTGTLGTVGPAGTYDGLTGDTVDVSNLENVLITVDGTDDLDATAAMTIQVSQDGTYFAATPSSSAFTYASPVGSYALTGRVRCIRALASAVALGGFQVRYAGWEKDGGLRSRFGSLGNLASQTTGTVVDVSELENVIVAVSSNTGATVAVQASHDGSDYVTITTFTNTNGSVKIPFPCKTIRCNATAYSSGTAYCSYGGVKSEGRTRTGTLGTFTSQATGTAYDVSDLDRIGVQVTYENGGTFAGAGTVIIEISQDGSTWAPAPGSSTFTGSGNLQITEPVRLIRARCSAFTIGTLEVRYGGVNLSLQG